MKSLRMFFLIALMIALAVFGTALAEEEVQTYTCGDYEYILNDGGTATITDYNGSADSGNC